MTKKKNKKNKPPSVTYLKLMVGQYGGHSCFEVGDENSSGIFCITHSAGGKKICKSTLADYPLLKASLGYDNIPRGLLNNVLNIEIAYFPG